MTVTVIGLGFVGLTTAIGFAELGHKVYGVEHNAKKREALYSGKIPFMEPGLQEAMDRNINKTFFLCDDLPAAVEESSCLYICVGTPMGDDGEANLKPMLGAVSDCLDAIKDDKFRTLVTKSTIPPSTTSNKIVPFVESKGFKVGNQIGICNNPEFLREGYCWDDFMNADRIVIGVEDEKSEAMLRELYAPMGLPVCAVSRNTGEFIKYLSNTLLATLISYSNEMSIIADTIGNIDTAEAFKILHMDKRWGNASMKSYVYPGCGYGGYCLPKDTCALYAVSKAAGFDAKLLSNVIETNNKMPETVCGRIIKAAKENKSAKIGILGLSFKPGSDDVRESPSAWIVSKLNEAGYENIVGFDPVANDEFKFKYQNLKIDCVDTYEECIEQADILVIATAWPMFKNIKELAAKTIVDCRYML